MQVEIIGMNEEDNTLNCFIEDNDGNIIEIRKVEIPDFLKVEFVGRGSKNE